MVCVPTRWLAAYKCSVDIRMVEELPETATGKINSNMLRNEIRSR
jgi:non-ribosomal peptide synthetase component E (peptide arylation enzyme)